MALFEFGDIKQRKSDETIDKTDKKQDVLIQKYLQSHYQAIDNVKELAGRFPGKEEIFFIWTMKSFNAFTFIQYVILEKKEIDEMVISSYNIGKMIILALMHLIDIKAIKKLIITISDVSKSRFPQNYELINLEASKRAEQVKVYYKWNHSKVALMKTGKDHFIVEGSGNFADNAKHEQYIFMNNKELYEFRKKWIIDEIIG
jgi:hypothetical protein